MIRLHFNCLSFLQREGATLVRSYQRLMATRKGISLDAAPHNAPATVLRKGKDHWMVHTDKLRRQGFVSQAWPMRLRVAASTEVHTRQVSKRTGRVHTVTHEDLFLYHNQGHPGKTYSGVFNKFPAGSQFPERFSREIYKQMRPQLEAAFTKRIKAMV